MQSCFLEEKERVSLRDSGHRNVETVAYGMGQYSILDGVRAVGEMGIKRGGDVPD